MDRAPDDIVRIARIVDERLDTAAHLAAVERAEAGASTVFVGTVRDHDPDAAGSVVALEYSAHPDAEQVLRRIALEAARLAASADATVAVSHRIGRVAVGESAVVVAVSTGHRGDAFAVCREVIEAIKRELPVWKRQLEADGSAAWKGLGG